MGVSKQVEVILADAQQSEPEAEAEAEDCSAATRVHRNRNIYPSNLEGLRKHTVPATSERHCGRPFDLTCITVLSLHELVHNTNTAHRFQQLRTESFLLASSILPLNPLSRKRYLGVMNNPISSTSVVIWGKERAVTQ